MLGVRGDAIKQVFSFYSVSVSSSTTAPCLSSNTVSKLLRTSSKLLDLFKTVISGHLYNSSRYFFFSKNKNKKWVSFYVLYTMAKINLRLDRLQKVDCSCCLLYIDQQSYRVPFPQYFSNIPKIINTSTKYYLYWKKMYTLSK